MATPFWERTLMPGLPVPRSDSRSLQGATRKAEVRGQDGVSSGGQVNRRKGRRTRGSGSTDAIATNYQGQQGARCAPFTLTFVRGKRLGRSHGWLWGPTPRGKKPQARAGRRDP